MKIKKAVIPAAGRGIRFLPLTKVFPKEMLPIIDRPSLEYLIDEAAEAGINEVLVIISREKDLIKDYFSKNKELEKYLDSKNKPEELELVKPRKDVKISYVYQDFPKGLGDAIHRAKEFVGKDDFAVLLGDDMYDPKNNALMELVSLYNKKPGIYLGCKRVPLEETKKYGVISGPQLDDHLYEVTGLVEKPKSNPPSNVTIAGRYILPSHIMETLDTQTPSARGEIEITDAILRELEFSKAYAKVLESKWYDLGSKLGYIDALLDFAIERDDLKEGLLELIKNLKK